MKFVRILAIVMLLLALFPMSEGYYTVLRAVVTGTALLAFFEDYRTGLSYLAIACLAVVVVYNPISMVHLNKKLLWVLIDLCTIGVLIWPMVRNKKTGRRYRQQRTG
jgi:purine-cytosine permease-like protein